MGRSKHSPYGVCSKHDYKTAIGTELTEFDVRCLNRYRW
jgi:hypothetical protein